MHKSRATSGEFFEFRRAENDVAAFGQSIEFKRADDPLGL
jgi:hypothetical protein